MIEALRDDTASRMDALRVDSTSRFDRIESRIERLDVTFVRKETYEAEKLARTEFIEGLVTRISALESTVQWAQKIVVGAVITAVLAGLFTAQQAVG